jgi:myo-inositol-1(or 4)-monophosphatase
MDLSMKQTLLSALKVSGKELLKHFGHTVNFTVKESQSSIVTKADLKSDSLIVKLIRERFPTHSIISEESGYSNMNSKYTWVIDPLDGTSNFASALPWFGILITVFENNIPIMGGAFLPVQDQLYFAEKGKGAFKNGKTFIMAKNRELKNSLFSFSVDFTDNEIILNESISIYRNLIKAARNIRSTNSLVDFLYVAEGKFGGCINLFTRIWDISALGLIISEAGGVMKDIKGDDIQFTFNENIAEKNFAVMAGSVEIISEIRKAVL